jgi:hypothetical protein
MDWSLKRQGDVRAYIYPCTTQHIGSLRSGLCTELGRHGRCTSSPRRCAVGSLPNLAPEAALETDTHLASTFSVEDEKHRVLLYGGRSLGFIHDSSLPALIESSR